MAARKFAFDTEFAPDGTILNDATSGARRFTPDEVETARAAAYAQGKDDATAAAERAAAAALSEIAASAGALLQTMATESQAMRTDAAQLALVAARKIAGAALDAFGEARALGAIEAAMESLRHGPRLIIRTPQHMADALKPRIEEMAAEHGFGGAIVVRPDANLKAGAVVLDWTDGVVRIDPAEIAERIDALITTALAGAATGDAA